MLNSLMKEISNINNEVKAETRKKSKRFRVSDSDSESSDDDSETVEISVRKSSRLIIPHTGDKASLDRCG